MYSTSELIDVALKEDIGHSDITTENLIDADSTGVGKIIAREPLVIAGLDTASQVFQKLDPEISFRSNYKDGDTVEPEKVIAEIKGKVRALLMGERVALNFLQHLSGIATVTRSYISRIKDLSVRLVDTRKTTPGWRVLEKYAVRVGGANNHRMGLYDGVLIKDNHIAASGGIAHAVKKIKNNISHLVKIEVEVSSFDQVKEAVDSRADVIMLDNMDVDQINKAVQYIDHRAIVEVSGGVTAESLIPLAQTGVDIISAGALTHSAGSVDISMNIK